MSAIQKTNTAGVARLGWLDKLYVGLLLAVFGGIVLHAPLSVGLSTLWPDYSLLIKSWKEILLGAALLLLIVILTMRRQWALIKTNHVIYLIIGFALLNVLLIPLSHTGSQAILAGILINLRYLLFFALVYAAILLYPQYYRPFLYVFIGGMAVVIVFAILQLTVLPHDILKYLGYTKETIAPYLTVDQNPNYIRINSTLRGPNPLGAYAVIVLGTMMALWFRGPKKLSKPALWTVIVLGLGSVAALWASYSRSAVLGAVVAVGLVVLAVYGVKIGRKAWIVLGIVALVLCGSLVAFRDTQFVSQVILHQDPLEGNHLNSNEGHAQSLAEGLSQMVKQPLGGGIGSTGSASLLSNSPLIIENQYLFVAHETGWLGLILFVWITILVLVQLWKRRRHWLNLGVFASGAGLAIVGLVLPVWVDETVAMVWWGAAALALAIPLAQVTSKSSKRDKSHG
ncbi:MAG TPA: O-antigen ligase family protein [Dongiaceae bacterium]|nr:O-antigen ligase family protein [Dongiaceae bacterium]